MHQPRSCLDGVTQASEGASAAPTGPRQVSSHVHGVLPLLASGFGVSPRARLGGAASPQRVMKQPVLGEVVPGLISTALLVPHPWEKRSMMLMLSNAEMLLKSPCCPVSCSHVNFCTVKVICLREFYLCKSPAIFHAIHIS